ncbi:aminotransferase class V-fold PLP-dependent enzyme [Streptomyces sp. JNUCC 64]
MRDQFALSPDLAHFSAYTLASHPAPVRAAIARYRDQLDRDTSGALERNGDREVAVREAAAGYLGVPTPEVALTGSTTAGIAAVYLGLRLPAGSEILTTEHEFHSTHAALRAKAVLDDVTLRRTRLYDDPATASPEEMTERLTASLTPRTRVLALTWVHSTTGIRIPVPMICSAVAEINRGRAEEDRVLVCLDAVHGLGVATETPAELGCDFLMSGTHKWLYGPRGTGIVWGRRDAWRSVEPVVPSFGWMSEHPPPVVDPGMAATPGGYHAFEHQWALDEAFSFHLAIGKERVWRRISGMAGRLKEGLAELEGVRLVTPGSAALSGGIVSFSLEGHDPWEVVAALRNRHRVVADVTPYGRRLVRLGPTLATGPADVERAIRAVAALR